MEHSHARAVPDRPGPTVVMVPGLGLDARSWQRVRDRLTGDHRVVLLPSMGRPAPASTDLRVERQAGRLLDELRAHQVCAAILVGHSAGCAVAAEAVAQSSVVVGLVLIGPVTDPRGRSWPAMVLRWVRTATHERAWEAAVLLPQYLSCGLPTMLRSMDVVRRYAIAEALARITVPVVVVRGSRDRIAPHDWAADLVRPADRSLVTAAGSGHLVPLTEPAAVVHAVDRVTASLASAPWSPDQLRSAEPPDAQGSL